jgi:hypothetical protein
MGGRHRRLESHGDPGYVWDVYLYCGKVCGSLTVTLSLLLLGPGRASADAETVPVPTVALDPPPPNLQGSLGVGLSDAGAATRVRVAAEFWLNDIFAIELRGDWGKDSPIVGTEQRMLALLGGALFFSPPIGSVWRPVVGAGPSGVFFWGYESDYTGPRPAHTIAASGTVGLTRVGRYVDLSLLFRANAWKGGQDGTLNFGLGFNFGPNARAGG